MDERKGTAHVLRRQPSSKIQRRARHMGMDINATWKNEHPAGIDGPSTLDISDHLPVGNTNVFDDAVETIGWIVNFATRYAQHP
jgi:hypothetical protein